MSWEDFPSTQCAGRDRRLARIPRGDGRDPPVFLRSKYAPANASTVHSHDHTLVFDTPNSPGGRLGGELCRDSTTGSVRDS